MSKFKSNMRSTVRERAQMRDSSGGVSYLRPKGEIEFFKIKKKKHLIDIIPYVVTDHNHPDRGDAGTGAQEGFLWYSRRYFVHGNVGVDKETIVCPNKTFGKKCPICEYMQRRRAEGAEWDEIKEFRPKERQLFNVIDLNADPEKVLLFDISYHLFGKQLIRDLLEGEEIYDSFAELEGGYSLNCRFEEKTFNGRNFWECDRVDFKAREEDYDDSVVDSVQPLDDILVCLPYAEIESKFMMNDEETEPSIDIEKEEEEEKKPTRKKKAIKKIKTEAPEESYDDEESTSVRTVEVTYQRTGDKVTQREIATPTGKDEEEELQVTPNKRVKNRNTRPSEEIVEDDDFDEVPF